MHKGQLLSEIPADYVEWLLSLDHIRNPLRGVVEQELELRAEEAARAIDACPDVQIADELIGAGVRALAKKYHPDIGGTNQQMQDVNATAAWLRAGLRRLAS